MTRRTVVAFTGLLIGLVLGLVVSCSSHPASPSAAPETGALQVTSAAFSDGGLVPINYSCAGANLSPPLSWHGAAPKSTAEWAIVVTDTSVQPAPFVHWLLTGIGAQTRTASTGQVPAGAVVGPNSSATRGYVGLCPPNGQVDEYAFTVYALSGHVSVAPTDTATALLAKITLSAISRSTLTGHLSR
jgi:Raf kinase inhibitor-like YbhB/YbcL family protein